MTTKCTLTLNKKSLEEYLEKIQMAGKDIDAAADNALLAGAEVIQEEMIRLAPVRTYNLAQSIKIKGPIVDGNYHYVDVGVINDLAFTDAETARYGNAQEYGTSKMAAHPYIRPGIDNSEKAARQAMRESLKKDGIPIDDKEV
jgi:HK97 gp10 family phage protein